MLILLGVDEADRLVVAAEVDERLADIDRIADHAGGKWNELVKAIDRHGETAGAVEWSWFMIDSSSREKTIWWPKPQ